MLSTKWELRGGIWVPSSEPTIVTGFWDRVQEELKALDMASEEARENDRRLQEQIERDGSVHVEEIW